MHQIPRNIIVDEAYMEFTTLGSSCSDVLTYKNLFFIRTFSKLFGLAGMRLGYLVHNSNFTHTYSFKNVLNISKLCGLKVFDNMSHYANIRTKVITTKMLLGFESAGDQNHGNFIFIRTTHDQVNNSKSELENLGIQARYGYGNGIRISINPDMSPATLTHIQNFITKYNTTPDIRTLYVPIDTRIHLVKMLKLFTTVINRFVKISRNNLQWWADGGTRLGAERHGAIIPWDDDIDIGFLDDEKNDHSKMTELLTHNFNLKRNITDRYYQICDKSFDGHPRDTIHIDIFPYINLNGKIVCNDERFRDFECYKVNNVFTLPDLLPLRLTPFYDFQIPVPNTRLPSIYNHIEIRNTNKTLMYYSDKVVMS